MKKSTYNRFIVLIFRILFIIPLFYSCKKTENPIKFPHGTFPDTLINLADINSVHDDYNADIFQLNGYINVVFSSNRNSSGGEFDIEQGVITFTFSQTDGIFGLGSEITNDPFTDKLLKQAVTAGNDFGPYRLFSTEDGFEYFLLSSVNEEGNLDLFYLRNQPVHGPVFPVITGPDPVRLFNTGADDAYICFDSDFDSAYFTSDRDGSFDIFVHNKPAGKDLSSWFDMNFESSAKADSINSNGDDKCPNIHRGIMVFASNRPGGMGGYDLYYSIFKNGKWNSPVNFGPEVNTSFDEYRPVLGSYQDFTNSYLIFSSDRTGGKGGFDLYFMGIELPGK